MANRPIVTPATTTAPAPMEQPSRNSIGADRPVVTAGKLTSGGHGARVTIIGQDRARADEDAVADRYAVVDKRPVLDLDAVAEADTLVDEGVSSDDALGSQARSAAQHGTIPHAGVGADANAGLELC